MATVFVRVLQNRWISFLFRNDVTGARRGLMIRHDLAAMVAIALAMPTPSMARAIAAVPPELPPVTAEVGSARLAPVADEVTLPANTEIWLAPLADVSSKHIRQGGSFAMRVSRDVFVGRDLAIPRGTTATGQIVYRTGKGAFGKSGKMEFDPVQLDVAHGKVPVHGHYRVEGQGNTGAAIGVFIVAGLLGAVFVTGHSATISSNTEWRAYTGSPMQIALGDLLIDGVKLTGRRASARLRPVMVADDFPANSAYVPVPAEMVIRTLPAQP